MNKENQQTYDLLMEVARKKIDYRNYLKKTINELNFIKDKLEKELHPFLDTYVNSLIKLENFFYSKENKSEINQRTSLKNKLEEFQDAN